VVGSDGDVVTMGGHCGLWWWWWLRKKKVVVC